MDVGLRDKKAIVTGASRGIGRAIAQLFVDEGFAVAICARDATGTREAASQLQARGGHVVSQTLDVGDGQALKSFVDGAARELGGLDILDCNPGAGGAADEEAWRRSFEVDLMGAVRSVDSARPSLVRSEAASIVFICTTAAVESFAGPGSRSTYPVRPYVLSGRAIERRL